MTTPFRFPVPGASNSRNRPVGFLSFFRPFRPFRLSFNRSLYIRDCDWVLARWGSNPAGELNVVDAAPIRCPETA